jgi:putative addiction module component (TIGR02574 family)
MSSLLDDWKAQLDRLSPNERAELAHYLLSSLDDEDEGVEAAWDAEAARRVTEIRSGTATGRDADGFLGELRERYP